MDRECLRETNTLAYYVVALTRTITNLGCQLNVNLTEETKNQNKMTQNNFNSSFKIIKIDNKLVRLVEHFQTRCF